MKKVILVLVLALGVCVSAFASACVTNPFGTGSCSATVDGTTFNISLIGLTNTSLTNSVNINVNASSSVSGTDVFSVQVLGATPVSGQVGVNYDLSLGGHSNAAVTSVTTVIDGKGLGGMLSTGVAPSGGSSLGQWNLTSSSMMNNFGSHAVPSFVSAEVTNELNMPSGLTLAGFTETFTVVWTASSNSVVPVSPSVFPAVPTPNTNAPEPASIGLVAVAGLVGGLFVRRRSRKK
jgi:hypothetical protein